MSKITWSSQTMKVKELVPAEYNPRQMKEKQATDLKASLDRFGLADPVIVNADRKVIGGHQRLRIMLEQGVEECDVRVPSRQLDEREERELNVRLNKNNGEWDWDKLMEFDVDLLKHAGFRQIEIDAHINPGALKPPTLVEDVKFKAQKPLETCPSCGYRLDGSAV